ncbi:MAG TPA: penicillin-binding protein activator [Hyphomonadaceae bacterium]|nr:penicillin-binding protein activator [Hyphomonadaceae bacterium]
MPSESRARQRTHRSKWIAASALALVAVAGCASGPPRPTTPTYSGATRPDPTRPPRPGDPMPSQPVSERFAGSRNAYMPRHLAGQQTQGLKRVAVLLPFSSTNAEVQRLTQGLYNSIQMALFEIGARDVVLMPRDTSSNDPRETASVAEDAIRDGAVAVIGPLFAQQVAPVASEASDVRAPVFAFSTDEAALGKGAYLVSLTPRTEVERIVEWATSQGIDRFAMLGPNNTLGHTVETALREEAAQRGAQVVSVEFYPPGDSSPQEPARRVAMVVKAENAANPGKVGVLIPESGVQLRSVAALLPYVGNLNIREIRFLGTGLWNDPEVWRESALRGGAFPATDPVALADFERRYKAIFAEDAPRLASYGYDAGALVATLASNERLDAAMIQRVQGWGGVNGLFRFLPDGGVERGLVVRQIVDANGEPRVVSPAIKEFAPGS